MKKNQLRIPLRVVFYQDDGDWVAHCLEFDLMGDGATKEEAVQQLGDAIMTQVDYFMETRDPATLFSPAPPDIQQMFAAGDDEPNAMLTIERIRRVDDYVEFEEIRYRRQQGLCPA